MKIRIMTHCDMDGAGSEIILRNVFEGHTILAEACSYRTVCSKLTDFFRRGRHRVYDQVWITDLAIECEEETEFEIGAQLAEHSHLHFVDHHPQSMRLQAVTPGEDQTILVNTEASATRLLYDYMHNSAADLSHLARLVKIIDNYDRWIDHTKVSRCFNYLYFGHYWHEKFVQRFMDGDVTLSERERRVIQAREKEYQGLIRTLKPTEFLGGELLVVMTDRHINEVCHHLLKTTGAGVVANINPKTRSVSLRSRGGVDVSQIAEKLGGGGHPRAAGFGYDKDSIEKLIQVVSVSV